MRVARWLILVSLALALGACSSETTEPSQGSASSEASPEPARPVFSSNVKYDVLEVLIRRGAVAPVIDTFRCTWESTKSAVCTGTGYDNAQESSQCGYELLPCGRFELTAHATCVDSRGHGCDIELDVQPLVGGADTTEQTSTADVQSPPTMPDSVAETRACGSLTTPDGHAYDVYLVKTDGSFGCSDVRHVVASGVDVEGWVYFDWTKGGNGPWSDVWQRDDTQVLVGATLTDWPGKRTEFDADFGFQTPSGNMVCNWHEEEGTISCVVFSASSDLGQKTWTLPARGAASVDLLQSNIGTDVSIVPYGETRRQGDITCASQESGLTCENGSGNGFFLSRREQRVY